MDKKTKILLGVLCGIILLCLAVAAVALYLLLSPAEPEAPKTEVPPPTVIDPATVVRSPSILGNETYTQISETRRKYGDLITEFRADGYPVAYDKTNNVYYLSVADESIGQFTGISFSAVDEYGDELNLVFYEDIDKYSYFKPENNGVYRLRAYSKTEYKDAMMIITTMPFLTIDTDGKGISRNSDTKCTITLRDGNWREHGAAPVTVTEAVIHTRGASAASFPKKAYKFSMRESDYETNRNISLLGLRSDDDYVLDAMYIDPTRMHNGVATEIWNKMDPSNRAADGEYVEVILNGEYVGLYDLLEPIDQKQLNLDEENGLLIKSVGWIGTYFDKYEGTPLSTTWMDFELKYPKEDIDRYSWGLFYDLVEGTADYREDEEGFLEITEHFDHRNLTDYWLFLTVFSLRDNRGKNLYWSTADATDPDSVFIITPWDCDLGMGYRYGKGKQPILDLPHHRDHYENDYIDDFKLLRYYIEADVNGAKDTIVDRWDTLTAKGGILSLESVKGILEGCRVYLEETGAWEREKKRWPSAMTPDSEEEFEYMYEWLDGRYEWMEDRILEVCFGTVNGDSE